jgi:hypothetical protein
MMGTHEPAPLSVGVLFVSLSYDESPPVQALIIKAVTRLSKVGILFVIVVGQSAILIYSAFCVCATQAF